MRKGRLTKNELLFLSVFSVSVLGLIPSAINLYDSHKNIAIMLLMASFGILFFVGYLLYNDNLRPR